jgi:hypothetical protein
MVFSLVLGEGLLLPLLRDRDGNDDIVLLSLKLVVEEVVFTKLGESSKAEDIGGSCWV